MTLLSSLMFLDSSTQNQSPSDLFFHPVYPFQEHISICFVIHILKPYKRFLPPALVSLLLILSNLNPILQSLQFIPKFKCVPVVVLLYHNLKIVSGLEIKQSHLSSCPNHLYLKFPSDCLHLLASHLQIGLTVVDWSSHSMNSLRLIPQFFKKANFLTEELHFGQPCHSISNLIVMCLQFQTPQRHRLHCYPYLFQFQSHYPYQLDKFQMQQLPSVQIAIEHPLGEQKKYLHIMQKVLAVDREIDEKNVGKQIIQAQNGLTIRVTAREVKLLRACVTGILRHMRLVAQTVREFKNVQ